jgi:hypothetical protein
VRFLSALAAKVTGVVPCAVQNAGEAAAVPADVEQELVAAKQELESQTELVRQCLPVTSLLYWHACVIKHSCCAEPHQSSPIRCNRCTQCKLYGLPTCSRIWAVEHVLHDVPVGRGLPTALCSARMLPLLCLC